MTEQNPAAPAAERIEHIRSHHGDDVVDNYEWLRDKTKPEVLAHLEAENSYTEAATAHLESLRETIFTEIKSRTKETDLSVPVRHGHWWYYGRTVEGQQYPIRARIAADDSPQRPVLPEEGAPEGEQILLDGNVQAAGEEFFSLGAFEVSPAADLLAFAVDVSGDERFDLIIRDVSTGENVDSSVTEIGYGVAWSSDQQFVFYTRVDEAWRPYQVWRHTVGTDVAEDVLVYQEDDERFWMGIGTSRDEKFLEIGLGSKNTSEYRLLRADDPTGDFQVVAARVEGVEYEVEAAGDTLWIVHNRNHPEAELARTPVAGLGSAAATEWETVMPAQDGVRILGVSAFVGHLAVSLRREGLAQVEIHPLTDGDQTYAVPVDEPVYTVGLGTNLEYRTDTVQVIVESLVTPPTVFDLNLVSAELTLVKQHPVLGGYDSGDYVQHRLWATAPDGAQIPISLVARRDITPDGTAPALLYGYGSYEMSIDPYFSVARLSYLDRGVVYAIAHIRGGGEMGRLWYENGRMEHKANTFSDFVAAADHLVSAGWSAPERLAAVGGSAGGLLVGAAMNLAPGRFRVVHAAVPFVDALTTILDPSLPLTVGEWEEWGNPLESEEIYQLMRSYTPYENIQPTEYPAILATTGLNDTRVFFVEPAKWVARLRETVTNDPVKRPILLKTEMVAGHGGKTGRYDAWKETAFNTAFVLDQLGVQ